MCLIGNYPVGKTHSERKLERKTKSTTKQFQFIGRPCSQSYMDTMWSGSHRVEISSVFMCVSVFCVLALVSSSTAPFYSVSFNHEHRLLFRRTVFKEFPYSMLRCGRGAPGPSSNAQTEEWPLFDLIQMVRNKNEKCIQSQGERSILLDFDLFGHHLIRSSHHHRYIIIPFRG